MQTGSGRRVWALLSVLFSTLVMGCPQDSFDPPMLQLGSTITVMPQEITKKLGEDAILTVTYTPSTKNDNLSVGATGFPTALSVDETPAGIVSELGPGKVGSAVGVELVAGNPALLKFFSPVGTPTTMQIGYRCENPGTVTVLIREGSLPMAGAASAEAKITCSNESVRTGGSGEMRAMMGELRQVTWDGQTWNAATHTATANLVERSPELAAKFKSVGEYCETWSTVTQWTSVKGASPVRIEGLQSPTATWDEVKKSYVFSGLSAGVTLPVSGDIKWKYTNPADNTAQTVSVPVPGALGDPASHLSPATDTNPTFGVTEGSADKIAVMSTFKDGQSGFTCLFPIGMLPLVDGFRWAPLFPAEIKAALPDLKNQVQNHFVFSARSASTMGMFPTQPEATPLYAARGFRFQSVILDRVAF